MKYLNTQKGVSIYIAVMIIAILLAIVLGTGAILLGQLKMIKGMENSIIAFYAADTGVERALMDRTAPDPVYFEVLNNGAYYIVVVFDSTVPGCSADNFCIFSSGTYKETKRAIKVMY